MSEPGTGYWYSQDRIDALAEEWVAKNKEAAERLLVALEKELAK